MNSVTPCPIPTHPHVLTPPPGLHPFTHPKTTQNQHMNSMNLCSGIPIHSWGEFYQNALWWVVHMWCEHSKPTGIVQSGTKVAKCFCPERDNLLDRKQKAQQHTPKCKSQILTRLGHCQQRLPPPGPKNYRNVEKCDTLVPFPWTLSSWHDGTTNLIKSPLNKQRIFKKILFTTAQRWT